MNTFVFDNDLAGIPPPAMCPPADWGEPIEGLPMLPPPKRFLLPGSTFHVSDDTTYHFYLNKEKKPQNSDAVDVSTSKLRVYKDKLQLIRAKFFFKRHTNCMAEQKAGFSMLTYSIEKRALYVITSLKPNNRWIKTIRRVSLNKFCIKRLEFYDRPHRERWVTALYDAVKRDIPDVYDECDDMRNRIIALIMQHRMDKGIPGLDDLFIENLGHVTSTKYADNLVRNSGIYDITTCEDEDAIGLAVRRMQRRTVYKFLPTLKKTGSMVKAFKVLFGEHFSRTLMKIMTNMPINHIGNGNEARFISQYNQLAPTGAKHMLSGLLKKEEYKDATRLAHQISVVMAALDAGNISPEIASNWSKTMSKIDAVINWMSWKDIYSMAEQLRTRVRPSRFNSLADVMALHDAYTRLIVALGGKGNSLNLPPEELVFLPADVPKEYNGYKVYQLLSQADLTLESEMLGHCVAGYAEGCMMGHSILVSLHDADDNKTWTVQYTGDDCSYIQAEGKTKNDLGRGRTYPSGDIVDSVIKPLGKAIHRAESNKPLSYSMRADLRTKHVTMLHGLITIEESTLEDDVVEEHIEAVNCQLERVVEVINLMNRKVPPSNEHLLQLVAKIDAEGADRYLSKRNRPRAEPALIAAPAVPRAIPLEDIVAHIECDLEPAPPVGRVLDDAGTIRYIAPGNDNDDVPF
jgi:hypothetical protein